VGVYEDDFNILAEKLERKRLRGRYRCRWECNIKMDIKYDKLGMCTGFILLTMKILLGLL
jgi:hypothetical protein